MLQACNEAAHDEADVLPLRFPLIPFADESLPGLMARATREHVLESTAVVLARAGIEALHPGSVCTEGEATLRRFARALRCDELAILQRAHWYCGDRQRGGPVTFGDAVVYREDLVVERRRIAPITLQGSEHHRAWWLLSLLPYCPLSLERLVDRCPSCPKKRLGWRRAWGIARCESCGEIVPPSAEPSLPRELVDGYLLFANLLSIEASVRARALSRLPVEVQELDADTLLNVTLKVGATCRDEPIQIRRGVVHSLPPELLASVVSVGTTMISRWPNSIQDWARTEFDRLDGNYEGIASLRRRLRWLGLKASAPPAQMALVRRALPDMFLSFDRSFANPEEIVLGNEAAKITGLDLAEIRSLREAGHLTARFEHGSRRKRRQYIRSQIQEVADAVRGSKPSSFLEWRLGLPLYAIEQLCCLGVVEREDHPALLHLRPGRHLKAGSAKTLLERLERGANGSSAPHGTLVLGTAARRIGGRAKPWGAIVQALLGGDLPYWLGSGTTFARRVRVARADLAKFDRVHFKEEAWQEFPFSPMVTQRDAEDILNIDALQMRVVRAEELLHFVPVGTSLRTNKAGVLALANELIATAELSARTMLDPRRVPRRMAELGVPRIAFGWERHLVEPAERFAG